MGLDAVELVKEIEDEFGIDIPDQDASRLETVGQTFDYLRSRLASIRGDRCVTMQMFHRLRNAIVEQFQTPRRLIRPLARIDALFKPEQVKSHYRQVGVTTALELPPLVSPVLKQGTNWGVIAFLLLIWILPFFYLDGFRTALSASILASLITLCVAGFTLRRNIWHRWRVMTTDPFAKMVQRAVIMNKLAGPSSEWTDQHIWLTLKHIISEQLGIGEERIKPDLSYVRDLGVD